MFPYEGILLVMVAHTSASHKTKGCVGVNERQEAAYEHPRNANEW